MKINSYKNLIVWQKSVDLAEDIYLLTKKFPKDEVYGLSNQMRRAAVSISSNIAEGQQRNNLKEYIQFLSIACGSTAELETQINIAKRIYKNFDYSSVEKLIIEIQKMISTLIKNLKYNSSITYNLKPKTYNGGQLMITTILILSGVIISAAVLLGFLIIYKVRQTTDFEDSAKAIFMSDAGREWALYKALKAPGRGCPSVENNAGFTDLVWLSDGTSTLNIISSGEANKNIRAWQWIWLNDNNASFSEDASNPDELECP